MKHPSPALPLLGSQMTRRSAARHPFQLGLVAVAAIQLQAGVQAAPDVCARCCADALAANGNQSAPCSRGCFNCVCHDKSQLCGCAHCPGWAKASASNATHSVEPSEKKLKPVKAKVIASVESKGRVDASLTKPQEPEDAETALHVAKADLSAAVAFGREKAVFGAVGNGWCLNSQKKRIAPPGDWQNTGDVVREGDSKGTSAMCEKQCLRDDSCIGYMTQDLLRCSVLVSAGTGAGGGIRFTDRAKRHYCWKKEPTAARTGDQPKSQLPPDLGAQASAKLADLVKQNGAAVAHELQLALQKAKLAIADVQMEAQAQRMELEVQLEKVKAEEQAQRIRFNQLAQKTKLEVELERTKARKQAAQIRLRQQKKRAALELALERAKAETRIAKAELAMERGNAEARSACLATGEESAARLPSRTGNDAFYMCAAAFAAVALITAAQLAARPWLIQPKPAKPQSKEESQPSSGFTTASRGESLSTSSEIHVSEDAKGADALSVASSSSSSSNSDAGSFQLIRSDECGTPTDEPVSSGDETNESIRSQP